MHATREVLAAFENSQNLIHAPLLLGRTQEGNILPESESNLN